MGRHTTPGTGTPAPDRGFWLRLGAAAVVVLLVGGWLVLKATGGGDGQVGTAAGTGTPTSSPADSGSATLGSSPSSTPAASTSSTPPPASPSKRPPTLEFTVRYPAYITVRVPGGVTLVSKLFPKGAHRSYDKKELQVVNGRPEAVRFLVNGKPHKPGPSGQTEIFTVRRP